MIQRSPWILPVIVVSQFFGTSIWFSGNAVLEELLALWTQPSTMAGWITSAVQLGFIAGTLVFAAGAIADRFSPRLVFLLCAAAGALANLLPIVIGTTPSGLLAIRFACGFFLAGIYPVGMKIAAGWSKARLGNTLGYLIGALVLGTAFPHLVKSMLANVGWQVVMAISSGVCLSGGVLMYILVPDGPHLVKGHRFHPVAVASLLAHRPLRAAALGYFGHMWELYTLWAFLPLFLQTYTASSPLLLLDVPLWSFLIIGMGCIGCIVGGMISGRVGSERVARVYLLTSGVCCLLSPLFFALSPPFFLFVMLLWGMAVVGDSPQFSTLVAHTAPPDLVGSALTLVNCIGFSITVISLALLQWISIRVHPQFMLLVLAPGPAMGLLCMRRSTGGSRRRWLRKKS